MQHSEQQEMEAKKSQKAERQEIQMKKKMREFGRICNKYIYEDSDGPKFYEMLCEYMLSKPVCVVGQSSDYGFFREGQNDVVRILKNAADEYRENQ